MEEKIDDNIKTLSNKEKFGEVITPKSLVEEMYHVWNHAIHNTPLFMDDQVKIRKIFEPGSGNGVFYDVFYNHDEHPTCFGLPRDQVEYTMNEINAEHESSLKKRVHPRDQSHTKLIMNDVFNIDFESDGTLCSYDLVVGNLPFNSANKKFVPALSQKTCKSTTQYNHQITAKTIWTSITHLCFEQILADNGIFFCIIPCIWLKPDRAGIYELFCNTYTIHYLRIYNCQDANKIFRYNCQTPICYVMVQKKWNIHKMMDDVISHSDMWGLDAQSRIQNIQLYCTKREQFHPFQLIPGLCIPTHHADLFQKHISYFVNQHKNGKPVTSILQAIGNTFHKISSMKPSVYQAKTMETKMFDLQLHKLDASDDASYKIITGAKLFKDKSLGLNGFVSREQGCFQTHKKLILPHKRIPAFLEDRNGEYGCYGRDMYVWLCNTDHDMQKYQDLFQCSFIQEMIQFGFRVRMNFIEKYVFAYIPDPTSCHFDITEYRRFMDIESNNS